MPPRAATELSTQRLDDDITRAVADVDVSLLRWSLSLSPRERLRACTRATRALAKFRRVTPQKR